MAKTILIKKKIERNYGVLVYKKALMSKYRKNYILWDINYFVKMSFSTLRHFEYALSQKLGWLPKRNFTCALMCINQVKSWIDFDWNQTTNNI